MTRHLTYVVAAISVTGLGAAAPAFAQDANPWAGWYLGGNIGVSFGHASLERSVSNKNGSEFIPPADVGAINATPNHTHNGEGITGGIEGGYNYDLGGGWLLGVETDFVGLDTGTEYHRGARSPLLIPPIKYTISSESAVDWEFTLRPRLGYTFGPLLVYATVGLAVANLNMSTTISDNRGNSIHTSNDGAEEGFAAGGGFAYAFDENWSMKAEYLYSDFGSLKESASNQFATLTSEAKARPQVFRIGVDYHFGGPVHHYAPPPYVPPPVQAPQAPSSYMVFFDFNKSDLTPEAAGIVDTAAQNAAAGRVTQLTVTGHTDTVGSDAYNMRLSQRRAESVSGELQAKGIPSSEIAVVAKGKRDLLVPTGDGVREPQNRRVQIVFGQSPAS